MKVAGSKFFFQIYTSYSNLNFNIRVLNLNLSLQGILDSVATRLCYLLDFVTVLLILIALYKYCSLSDFVTYILDFIAVRALSHGSNRIRYPL